MGQCYEKGIRIYMENMGNKYFALNLLQEEPGALLEIPSDKHKDKNLHGLKRPGESFRNDEILKKQFNNFKRQYWEWRLNQKLNESKE